MDNIRKIRNFVIIAHIDHGKSTLADRLLEITETVPQRKMQTQYLDQLELERERGITIKMAPVKMAYQLNGNRFTLNLIDTPGHSDFAYEVSRSLAAVEGAILLVDATQGIQAQTLANYRAAKESGLRVIGAVNKIDVFEKEGMEKIDGIRKELSKLIETPEDEILLVSGKTGEGVPELIRTIIEKIPPPSGLSDDFLLKGGKARALIFDSFYDEHKGIVASVRVFDGEIEKSDQIYFLKGEISSKLKEIGIFSPELKPLNSLKAGEMGYLATGIRDTGIVRIGDTVITSTSQLNKGSASKNWALPGYREPKSVVFVSFYPAPGENYDDLIQALEKLRLNDSSIYLEQDYNEFLGRGFKAGFLGRLHFEITSERIRREFGIETVNTFPSVLYKVRTPKGWKEISKPEDFTSECEEIKEPVVEINILLPHDYLNAIYPLKRIFRMGDFKTEVIGDSAEIRSDMPLSELISDFDDKIKSLTSGFASFSYAFKDYKPAQVSRVDILVAGERIPGLSRFIPKNTLETESRKMLEKLKKALPKEQFPQSLQALADGRVIAREDIPALKKNVTGHLYGGDITRKMKLLSKQKKGKKKLKEMGRVRINASVFKELIKKD